MKIGFYSGNIPNFIIRKITKDESSQVEFYLLLRVLEAMLNFSMLYINFAGLGVGLGGWVGGQKIVKRLIYLNDF